MALATRAAACCIMAIAVAVGADADATKPQWAAMSDRMLELSRRVELLDTLKHMMVGIGVVAERASSGFGVVPKRKALLNAYMRAICDHERYHLWGERYVLVNRGVYEWFCDLIAFEQSSGVFTERSWDFFERMFDWSNRMNDASLVGLGPDGQRSYAQDKLTERWDWTIVP